MLPSLSMPCRLHPLTVCTQEAEQCHESFCRLCQSTLSAECVALSTHAFKGCPRQHALTCRAAWKLRRRSALQTKQCISHGGPGASSPVTRDAGTLDRFQT